MSEQLKNVFDSKWTVFGFCGLFFQVANFVFEVLFYLENDYLPQPFFHDKGDTFMDFYHPYYWADDDGRYTLWKSVYPPLIFCFYFLLKCLLKE